jgi:F-box and WD-40 domain protein MET30
MLQGLLAQCCFPQLSYLSASIRDLLKIDFVSALPPEVSFKILCFLDTTSLCKAAQVSRRWRQLADDDVVWHRMCEQHIDRRCTRCGWGLPSMEQKRLRASKRQIQLRAAGRGINDWSPNITPNPEAHEELMGNGVRTQAFLDQKASGEPPVQTDPSPLLTRDEMQATLPDNDYFKTKRPWKDVYKDRFKVGTNWKYGRCSTKAFRGHTNGVMCLQFFDNILATGSYDATIKIWDIETEKEVRTLTGHLEGVRCLQFDDTKLISGSLDGTLKVWNWRTGECLSTYRGHGGGVIGLHFDGDLLVSASVDKTIKIWNFRDKSIFTLHGHTDWVNAVKIDPMSRTIFSASDDLTIRLWDLDTRKCLRVLKGHVGQVQQVVPLLRDFELDDGEANGYAEAHTDDSASQTSSAEVSSPDMTQRVAVAADSRYNETFKHNTGRIEPPRYILTSALDSTIRLWEVHTGKCVKTFFGHVEGVWALAADSLRVVSGAEDRMIKVWDPRTAACEKTYTRHAGPVTCVGLSDSRMCSGSEDGEVKLYCFKDEAQAKI